MNLIEIRSRDRSVLPQRVARDPRLARQRLAAYIHYGFHHPIFAILLFRKFAEFPEPSKTKSQNQARSPSPPLLPSPYLLISLFPSLT